VKVSGCCFIKDAFVGAFTVFESMASLLPFVSDYTVMDLGSTDGTLQRLEQIAAENPRVRLLRGRFPDAKDAGAFASLANDVIASCPEDVVWYHQADEVWHQDLLLILAERLLQGADDLSFWRIQLGYNWQEPRWYPHLVHRISRKSDFVFVGDGMNTSRVFGIDVCSNYNAGWFSKWGDLGPDGIKPYLNEMVLDVSLLGGFKKNIPGRRALHAPFWHEEPVIPYRLPGEKQDHQLPATQWTAWADKDDRWTRTESPYDIPHIMKFHVGKTEYHLRKNLFEALCKDNTRGLLGL
jgi:glycosyltransferase involved in cell wall biosynthesis